jgi:hypothetical protein
MGGRTQSSVDRRRSDLGVLFCVNRPFRSRIYQRARKTKGRPSEGGRNRIFFLLTTKERSLRTGLRGIHVDWLLA